MVYRPRSELMPWVEFETLATKGLNGDPVAVARLVIQARHARHAAGLHYDGCVCEREQHPDRRTTGEWADAFRHLTK